MNDSAETSGSKIPASQEPSENSALSSVVMLSGDLLFASRVKSVAENAGFEFRFGGNLPEDRADAIRYVILDLSTRSGLTATIIDLCRQRCPQARLIAYGPHVQVEKLNAARQAGIELVMTNGQFNQQILSILAG